ncbi:MAG: UDP-3-O-(3-hydroxymyristoyl)glucosamine N-acyltransferase [Alphaproteobacteria bacterium]|nr:UDP-3-O-(3-hydroxymyristoyl)glucosamine N-acyltransferase [Alphaproteobacteria bacterium]
MADPRFFGLAGPFGLGEIAARIGADLGPGADGAKRITDVHALDEAGPEHLSFLDNRRYVSAFTASRAGACIAEAEMTSLAPAGMAVIVAKKPRLAFARACGLFYPEPEARAGRHASAVIDPSAMLGPLVEVEAGAVVGARAEIGAGCRIGANAVIGDGVVLGEGTVVGANASVSHALVGRGVVIYPGARIGTPGFGFEASAEGVVKVPQLGRVLIGDDVEVGANTTIDRGSGPDTVIGRGTMIDNLVQIGHNVVVGEGCILVALVGISGSARLGNFVVLAGQVGVSGHLHIGDRVVVGPQSGIKDDVPAGAKVMGSPAVPMADYGRALAVIKRLGRKGK